MGIQLRGLGCRRKHHSGEREVDSLLIASSMVGVVQEARMCQSQSTSVSSLAQRIDQ